MIYVLLRNLATFRAITFSCFCSFCDTSYLLFLCLSDYSARCLLTTKCEYYRQPLHDCMCIFHRLHVINTLLYTYIFFSSFLSLSTACIETLYLSLLYLFLQEQLPFFVLEKVILILNSLLHSTFKPHFKRSIVSGILRKQE